MAKSKPAPSGLPAKIARLTAALEGAPRDQALRLELGLAWLKAGEADRAIALLSAIPPRSRSAKSAGTAIAKARALVTAPRAPAGYIRHLFDQFAPHYDQTMLGDLSYRAPAHLQALAQFLLGDARDLSILDFGCGTGLAGAAFRARASRLDGIDLSPAMLDQARARGIYHALKRGDLESPPPKRARRYDLVLAADTFVYLGDLTRAFTAAHARLKANGLLLFTVERKPGRGFALAKTRRYRHSEAYIRTTARAAGFEIAGLIASAPRSNRGRPVDGLAIALLRL